MKLSRTSSLPKVSLVIRSAIFTVGLVLSTLLMSPVVLLMWLFPFSWRYRVARLWVHINLWVLRVVCGLSYRVHGFEHIPNERGLILCKHQAAFETFALYAIFPSAVFILKRELLRIPFWGWAMAALEPIAINRREKTRALKQVLKEGISNIEKGRWVVLFPEGTRVPPGKRGHYGSSGGLLAHRAGCPVLPVAHNAGEYWARNGFLKYPGVIDIHIGQPLDGSHLSAVDINREAEEWIESKMLEITGASYRR